MRRRHAVVLAACALAIGTIVTLKYAERERDRYRSRFEAPPLPLLVEPAYNPDTDIMAIARAAGEPPGIFRREDKPPSPFSVEIHLEGDAEPGEAKLAEEAERQLMLDKPENPGRSKSFSKWRTPSVGNRKGVELTRIGWAAIIRRVQPIPGGWKARVLIFPKVKTANRSLFLPRNHHIEVYSFKDGKLTLESESLDPDTIGPNPLRKPEDGICGIFVG